MLPLLGHCCSMGAVAWLAATLTCLRNLQPGSPARPPAHPTCRPLPPHLAAALQRTRHAQLQLERRLAMLTPDHDMVHQRNSRVFDLVRTLLLACGMIVLASRGSYVMDIRIADA